MEPITGTDLPLGRFIEIGLSWDMFGEKVDLDLTLVLLTDSGQLIDAVYYNKTSTDDRSVIHSGDEKTGDKEGQDEKITIDLEKISNGAKIFAILVTSASGQSFQKVETAEVNVLVDQTRVLTTNCGWQGDFHSMLSSLIFFADNKWKIKNVSQAGQERTFVEMIPRITSNLKFLVDDDTLKETEAWNTKTGKSFDLSKGDEIKIASCLNLIAMGLGWETSCDIDSSVITMDSNFNIREYIYFGNKNGLNDAIVHQGDNTTGIGKGDDENIVIDFSKISQDVIYLGCVINVFTSGKSFSDVTDAYCRLIDWNSKTEFCKYKLNGSGSKKACLMCYLKRDGENKWKIKATGEFFDSFNKEKVAEEIKKDVLGNVQPKLGEHYEGASKGPVNQKLSDQPANANDCCKLI